MTPLVRVGFVVGIILPLHSARFKLVGKNIVQRHHRQTVSLSYLRHIFLAGVTALYNGEIQRNGRLIFLRENFSYHCVIAVLVYLVVSVIYRKLDKHHIRLMIKHITLKADVSEYARRSAESCVYIVYLCIGVLFAKAVIRQLCPAFFRSCRKALGDASADEGYSYLLLAFELSDKLRHSFKVSEIHKRPFNHIVIYLLLGELAFIYTACFTCFG